MKKLTLLFTVFIILFAFTDIFSQGIPETINYQGILTDAAGVVVPDGDYNITFKLYDAASGGSELWNETKSVAVADGIINTELGSATPIPLPIFSDAAWLGITIESGSELTPRIALTSVPYSFISMNVPDGSLTASKIAAGEVLKSLNGLKDNVNLVAGSNVTITPGGNDITISATTGGGGIGGSGTTNYIPVFTNGTTLGNSVIYENGNKIGINNPTPDFALTIDSDPTAGLGLKLSRSTGGFGLSLLEDSQPTGLRGWFFEVYDQKLRIKTAEDNGFTTIKNLMTFQRDGYVGIGTDAPVTNLQLVNDQFVPGGGFTLQQVATSNRWQFYVSQSTDVLRLYYNDVAKGEFDNTNGNYTPVSDLRLKKNINPMNEMLSSIMQLKPKSYQMKDDNDPNSFSYGLIAQEVENVLPEIVATIKGDDGDGINNLRMLSYTELIPVLIKGMQEQQAIIENLKKRIENLENK